MPIDHVHAIRAGSTTKLLLVFAHDDKGRGLTGLRPDTAAATAAFIREGAAAATRVQLASGRLGEHRPGGFVEVDPDLMPGVYQFGVPDEMLAPGSERVMLVMHLPGAIVPPVEVHLVAYDPQDTERMGVMGLANDRRHEFLRRAMPRLTEMELELGRQAEEELRRQLTSEQG